MSSWNVTPKSGEGGGFEKPPAGNHPARLVAIIDMGNQKDRFGDEPDKYRRQACFVWELLTAKQSGTKGSNHVISCALTVSLHEKATLRRWVQARLGKKLGDDVYDIGQELGQPCMLSVTLNNGGYPKVDGVAAVPAGIPFPDAQHTPVMLTLDQIKDGAVIPDWVPWLYGRPLLEHVKESKELKAAAETSVMAGGTAGGPIPF